VSYKLDIGLLLIDMRYDFHEINADDQLTEADKRQLKDSYLQNFIAPKALKLLEKHFPEEFGKAAPSPAASKTRPHQDRH
jgi:hypothetical protein